VNRISAVVLLAGCNRLLGLDPTLEVAAPLPDAPPPGCAGALFGATTNLSVMTSDGVADPTLVDPLELWLTWRHPAGTAHVASATRTDTTQPFGTPQVASFAITDFDTDPAFTGNRLHVFFISSDAHIYEADRSSLAMPWSAARIVPGIDGEDASMGIDVTANGLAIYFSDVNYHLHTASRATLNENFGPVTDLAPTLAITFPSISPDQLELFYNPHNSSELHRLTRSDPAADFDPASDITIYMHGDDPDISADATTLIYFNQGNLQTAHRDCPSQ